MSSLRDSYHNMRDMKTSVKLMFMCGKMAAGKSTLARDLAERHNAVLVVQDEWLGTLFPREIVDIPTFLDRSARLRNALAPHICVLPVERHFCRARLSRQH